MRYITVALAKGRLADRAMEYFSRIGYPCEEMKDKKSRKLIFTNEEAGVRFFLAKASDVPTYVEYGAADLGIVGKDTILEEGRTLFEVLDRRIQNLSPDVKREFKKLYVAYKLDTNFVDIVFQKQRLRISVNMKFSEVIDPNGICRDITGLGRWGNGDVELYMEHTSDVDQIMEIVEQSYRIQADE